MSEESQFCGACAKQTASMKVRRLGSGSVFRLRFKVRVRIRVSVRMRVSELTKGMTNSFLVSGS